MSKPKWESGKLVEYHPLKCHSFQGILKKRTPSRTQLETVSEYAESQMERKDSSLSTADSEVLNTYGTVLGIYIASHGILILEQLGPGAFS